MSEIVTEIFRSGDERLLKAKVNIHCTHIYDHLSLELKSASGDLPIISTSTGSIRDNKVFSIRCGFIQLFTECLDDDDINCIVSYFRGQELVHFENIPIAANASPIQSDNIILDEISSIDSGYAEKIDHFNRTHMLLRTDWRVSLSVENDVIVRFLKHGPNKTYMSFGEITPELLSSDFIFTVDQKTSEIIIPKELVWSKYNSYSLDAVIGCCLIVTTDFHSMSNKYGKIKVSNSLYSYDLPRQGEARKLSEFSNPFGQPLKEGWKVDEMSHLPVYVEKL